MRNFIIIVLVLLVAGGLFGHWRGWFTLTKDGGLEVHIDPVKFKHDKEEFGKTAGAKAKALKADFASLLSKSERMTGDEKIHAQKELEELRKKHDRLEQQIKDLEESGQDRFEGLKRDLTKSLEECEKEIGDWGKKWEKGKGK